MLWVSRSVCPAAHCRRSAQPRRLDAKVHVDGGALRGEAERRALEGAGGDAEGAPRAQARLRWAFELDPKTAVWHA